jgi:hypothetical protein
VIRVPRQAPRLLCTRHRWWIAILAAYLYVFPYFPRIHSANELPRVFLVRAIVDEQTFAIDSQMRLWNETRLGDVSPYRDHIYSNKAPGSSLLAVPFYAAVRWTLGEPSLATSVWLCRVFAGIVPALLFLWLLWGFLARFAPEPDVRRLLIIAYAFGSMAMTFSLLFFSHQLSAVCIASAWILALDVLDRRRGMRVMLAVGLLAGAAPLVDYQAAFGGVPVAAHVMWRLVRWPRREVARAIALAVAGAAVPIALLFAYHAACFGSPLRTGYDASETYAAYHQQGFLGLTRPHLDALWGSFVSVGNGLFTLAPWWLLAIPGTWLLWRRGDRAFALVAAGQGVLFAVFVASLTFWRGGWSIGPRYITVMLPFLLPAVGATLTELRARPLALGAMAGGIVTAVVVYSGSVMTFPYWPDSLRDPLYEVTFRLVGDGVVAPSVASACGISGPVAMLPFVALVAGLTGWTIARAAGWRGLALAVAVGAALAGSLGLVPHGDAHADRAYVETLYPAATRQP